MSRKDYVPVGGILTRNNGKKYELASGYHCTKCAFAHKGWEWCDSIKCVPTMREDSLNVIFIRRKDLEEKRIKRLEFRQSREVLRSITQWYRSI